MNIHLGQELWEVDPARPGEVRSLSVRIINPVIKNGVAVPGKFQICATPSWINSDVPYVHFREYDIGDRYFIDKCDALAEAGIHRVADNHYNFHTSDIKNMSDTSVRAFSALQKIKDRLGYSEEYLPIIEAITKLAKIETIISQLKQLYVS